MKKGNSHLSKLLFIYLLGFVLFISLALGKSLFLSNSTEHLVSIYKVPRPALKDFGFNWRDGDTEKHGSHAGLGESRESLSEEMGCRWT